MPTSYNRYINLFIDGKQVEHSAKAINAALSKIRNEQRLMTIGSQEYIAAANKIKSLKGMLDDHNQAISNVSRSWSIRGLADGVNRYFALITTFMASFAGLALTVKSTVKAYAEFEDKLADVRKTTGLTKDQVNALNEELKKIDTRTAQMELLDLARVAGKLGLSDQSEILGFVRAADKIAVALTEDLGGNIEESVNELGKLVDIFKLKDQFGMEQSLIKVGSAINSLGAAGTANEGYLVEFAKRVAGIAPSANISIQNILGLGTTLDELGQTAEVAGTVYNSVISAMFKDTPTYAGMAKMSVEQFANILKTDANEAFIKVLEGAKGSGNGFSEMAQNLDKLGLDGARSTSVLAVLANNIDKLREKQSYSNQEFEKGTSLQKEFDIKNTTGQATLDKAKKGFDDLARKLGEQLTPAYTSVISKSSLLLKIIGSTIDFLYTYSGVIVSLISTVTAYTIAVKLQTLWQNRSNATSIIATTLQKARIILINTERAGIMLLTAAQALLTGNIARATQAWRIFNMVVKVSPLGLLAGAIVGIGTALLFYSKKLTDAQIAQKALNDITATAEQNIIDEKVQMEQLLRIAQNESLSKERRLEAIGKLNEISPEYLGGLTLETINTENATIATNNYVDALRKKAEVEAITENIKSANSKISRLQAGDGGDATIWQKAWNITKYGKNPEMLALANANTKTENAKARIKELTIQLGVYQTELDNKISAIDARNSSSSQTPGGGSGGGGSITKDLIKEQEDLLEIAKRMPRSTDEQIAARNKNIESIEREIARLNDLGKTHSTLAEKEEKQLSKSQKKKLEIKEANNKAAVDLINKEHLKGLLSDDQYNAKLLAQESDFLREKMTIYEHGSKEYNDAAAALSTNQVKAEKEVKDLLLKAEQELADARIDNLQDGIEKEKLIEKQKYDTEIADLKKRLNDKKKLSDDEIKLNDTINKIIEEKTAAHQKKMGDLSDFNRLKSELEDLSDISTSANEYDNSPFLSLDELHSYWQERAELLTKQYTVEKELARGNAIQLAAIEKKYSKDMAGIKLKEADAIHDVSLRKIDIAQQYLGVLSSVFEQESAMGKAIFLFQQGLAVASVWISTAQANAKAMAILALPPLWGPVVATNTANAAIQTGLIVAQTIGNFIGSSKKKKDYDTGGYTGDGGVYEPAGIVHRGEYVIPQWLVKNPALQPMIGMTEFLRRNKGLSGMQLNPLVQSGITAGGGYAAGGPISGIASGMQAPSFTIGSDPELKAINRALAEELKYLRENGIKAKVAGYGGEGSVADALTKIANLAKSVGLK